MQTRPVGSARKDGSGRKPVTETGERILLVLGLTTRPLASAELANALGLGVGESGTACRWLVENGYISVTETGQRGTQRYAIVHAAKPAT
jgi:hypothetical protein